MNHTIPSGSVASEGKKSDTRFQRPVVLETSGKRAAITCLHAAVESFLATHRLSRAELAEDLCGMSEANFSKVINGVQGDFLALLEDKLPADIRDDYYARRRELERVDPLLLALEQVQAAMWRFLRIAAPQMPERADRMAQADLTAEPTAKRA